MTKFHSVAGLSVSAACLGVTGAAVAFGGGSDTQNQGYTGNYDWKDYSNGYKVTAEKGGYDYNKHGDTKHVNMSDVHHASYVSDDNTDYNHDDESNDHDEMAYGHDADQASYHEDSSHESDSSDAYDHDKQAMMDAQNEWDNYMPSNWRDSGSSYEDYHMKFMEYSSVYSWEGGQDDWTPNYGEGWQDNWYNWDPIDWMEAGSSYENWHAQLHAYLTHCQGDWNDDESNHDSDYNHDENADYGHDDQASYHEDYSHDNGGYGAGHGSEGYNHDESDSEDSDEWSHNDDEHDYDEESNYSDSEHDYSNDDEWGGKVHGEGDHEVAYVVRN